MSRIATATATAAAAADAADLAARCPQCGNVTAEGQGTLCQLCQDIRQADYAARARKGWETRRARQAVAEAEAIAEADAEVWLTRQAEAEAEALKVKRSEAARKAAETRRANRQLELTALAYMAEDARLRADLKPSRLDGALERILSVFVR